MKKKTSKNKKAASARKGARGSVTDYRKQIDRLAAQKPETAETCDGRNPASGRTYFEVARAVGGDGNREFELSEQQKRLLEAHGVAIDLLLKAYNSMIELAAVRLDCKLSNTRVTGVARELRELIKVMSVYDC